MRSPVSLASLVFVPPLLVTVAPLQALFLNLCVLSLQTMAVFPVISIAQVYLP